MAVIAWTPKQVVDLLPKFGSKRLSGHRRRAEEIATDAGVGAGPLTILSNAPRLGVDVVTIDRYRWRNPYSRKDPWTPQWEELVGAGLAARANGGWRVTPRGTTVIERTTRDVRAYLEALPLPPVELRRATKTLADLAAAMPPDRERATAARRGVMLRHEVRSDIVRLDLALGELWLCRDDCHIAAWRKAAYGGPVLDTLSHVWEGRTTLDALAAELEARQERADVERCLEELVRRGDLARDGDSLALTPRGRASRDEIERETDRRYFAGWPTGDALARLGDDLSALIGALP